MAAGIFVSRRTVTTHLTSVFRKLGVSGRAELAARVGQREDRPDAGFVSPGTGDSGSRLPQADRFALSVWLALCARCAFWGRRAEFAAPRTKPSRGKPSRVKPPRVLAAGRPRRRLLPAWRGADVSLESIRAACDATGAGGMGVPDAAICRTTWCPVSTSSLAAVTPAASCSR